MLERLGQLNRYELTDIPLRRLIAIRPESETYRLALARCLFYRKGDGRAAALIEATAIYQIEATRPQGKMTEIAFSEGSAAIYEGLMLRLTIDPGSARLFLDEAAIRFPKNPDIAINRVFVLELTSPRFDGNPVAVSQIRDEYSALVDRFRDSAKAFEGQARFLARFPQWHDDAEGSFQRAVRLNPQDPESSRNYVVFLWRIRRNEQAARRFFDNMPAEIRDDPFNCVNRAIFDAYCAHDYDSASALLGKVREKLDGSIRGSVEAALGVVMFLGRASPTLQEAVFADAKRNAPNALDVFINAAWWSYARGDVQQGDRDLEDANRLLRREGGDIGSRLDLCVLKLCREPRSQAAGTLLAIRELLPLSRSFQICLEYGPVIAKAEQSWDSEKDFLLLLADVIHERKPKSVLHRFDYWPKQVPR